MGQMASSDVSDQSMIDNTIQRTQNTRDVIKGKSKGGQQQRQPSPRRERSPRRDDRRRYSRSRSPPRRGYSPPRRGYSPPRHYGGPPGPALGYGQLGGAP